jgi:transcriptional regulator with XRE-family HTH domain
MAELLAEGEAKKAMAARLRSLRDRAGMSRKDLAAAAGVSWRALEEYEAGNMLPGWLAVANLGRALGVTPDAFLPEGDTPGESPR